MGKTFRYYKLTLIVLCILIAGLFCVSCGFVQEVPETSEEETVEEIGPETIVAEGLDYLHGSNGKSYDYAKALDLFEEADKEGSTDASFLAGYTLLNGINDDEHRYEKAMEYLNKCKDVNPYAKICLGYLYQNGLGTEADADKAQELYSEAAKEKATNYLELISTSYKAEAGHEMAYAYYVGAGVLEDKDKAFEWFEDAEKDGNPFVYNWLGSMYMEGEGTDKDMGKAFEYFEKSAKLGNVSAMSTLGMIYYNGSNGEPDYDKAMEWFEKAYELESPSAAYMLGLFYFIGQGVEQDYTKALEYFTEASDGGDTNAMQALAAMYQNGIGVDKDKDLANELREKAGVLPEE